MSRERSERKNKRVLNYQQTKMLEHHLINRSAQILHSN